MTTWFEVRKRQLPGGWPRKEGRFAGFAWGQWEESLWEVIGTTPKNRKSTQKDDRELQLLAELKEIRGNRTTKGKFRGLHPCCWGKQDHEASVCPSKK